MALALSISTEAAPITWTNINGGAWSATTNWSPNTVPVAADDVFITNSGTYTVTMDVNPTISSLTLGGASGLQTLTNTSKTLTVSHASFVNANGIFGMNAGVLAGLGSLSISGVVHWNSGSSGSAFAVTVQSNAVLNVESTVTLSGVLTNLGTINWLAGNINVNSNAPAANGAIWNQTNALFDIQGDQVIGNSGALATFHNVGTFRKRTTVGTTTINVFLDNSGTVQAQTGTINIPNGCNLGGLFQANSGAAINFNGGTFTLSSPPNFQGPGSVQITAGNLTLNAFTGTYTLVGTTLAGQNTIAATGTINLNGSNLGIGATLTVLSNAVLNVTNTFTVSGIVTNLGTINWLAGNININSNAPAATGAIWNQTNALFDIQCDQVIGNSGALAIFHNVGTFRKRTTAGTTTVSVFMDNSGTVQAQTGTINIPNGSNLGGLFQANGGAAVTFSGGTYTLSSPPNFQGPGSVQITGGNLTLNAFTGTYTLVGGTLVGQNTVAATGTINLNGSNLGAGASLTVLSNAVLNITNTFTVSGIVTNLGTINWLAGNININSNAPAANGTIWNQTNALFDIQCDQVIGNSGALATFHNVGTFRKRTAIGTTTVNVFMDNSGTVQAQTGTITIANGSNLIGLFQANGGATINFSGGTYTLSSPPNFQGPGSVQITGGNLTLNAFTGIYTLVGGTLVGQNTVAATGTINLNGSNLGAGASLTVLSNAVLNVTNTFTVSGIVTNLGTINWLAGNINVNSNAPAANGAIWNQTNALFDIQCDQVIGNGGALATFHNGGTFRKRTTVGTTTVSVFMDNSGTVQAQTGTINFPGGGNLGGLFQANSGAAINFNGSAYTLSSPPNFQGPGPVQITSGNLTLSAFTGTYTLVGPTLIGQNTIAATGVINLNGSSLGAGASLTVLSNAVLNVTNTFTLSGIVTNLGTINWLAGNININSNAPAANGAIWNQTNALFDIQCDQVIGNGGALATFHNAGLMRKRTTVGTTSVNVFMDNSGTVQAQTGVISLSGGYTASPAATLAISLSGLAPNTGFGKIQFTAKPTFVGQFALNTVGGYRPAPGNSFFVISYPSAAGDFTSYSGMDLGSGLRLAPRSSAAGLSLVAVSYTNGPLPRLTVEHSVNGFFVAWPTNFTSGQLQFTTNLTTPVWLTVPVNGQNNTVVANGPQGYFRLFQ